MAFKKRRRTTPNARSSSIQAIGGFGEALDELGFVTGKLQFHFGKIPEDAGSVMEILCDTIDRAEIEFYLPHEKCLGIVSEHVYRYPGSAASIVSCRMDADCFDTEDSQGLYSFCKLQRLTLGVIGISTDSEDLSNMWLAMQNLPNLKELVIDLSASEFKKDDDIQFLKQNIPDNLPESFCNFSVKYITGRNKNKGRRR